MLQCDCTPDFQCRAQVVTKHPAGMSTSVCLLQMQFFLLCPLLMLCLRGGGLKGLVGRLAKACGGIVAVVTAYRAAIALEFKLPVPVFGPLEDPEALALMTRTLQVGASASQLPRSASAVLVPQQGAANNSRQRMLGVV